MRRESERLFCFLFYLTATNLIRNYFYFSDSPKFSPRQMSTPMIIRGPQGQIQPSKLNQSYQQGPMNQSYPGSPSLSMSSPFQQPMTSPAPFNQSSFMGNVTHQQRDPHFSAQFEYSPKHNGLYIYVGRILAPIWNLRCVATSMTPDKKEFVSAFIYEFCFEMQCLLACMYFQ